MASSPAEAGRYAADAQLRDGRRIRIRAIRPDDKQRLLGHFSRLSTESVYQRFFGVKKTLTPEDLVHFTELDFVDAVGLVATLGEGDQERIVGVGRYFVDPAGPGAPRRAEVAFAVEDAQQGRGIATQLLRQLIPFARRNGIVALEGDVLGDNIHMLHVFSRMGFAVSGSSHGVVSLSLSIAAHDMRLAAPRERAAYGFLSCRVSDAMTRDVVTVRPETPLSEVEALFERHAFNGVPVVDEAGVLVGLLTKLDMLRAFAFTPRSIVPHYEEILRWPAQRAMTRDPHTVDPDMPLTRVLEELLRTRYKSLPVVRDGHLEGIVSREDVLAALRRAAA